MRCCIRKIRCDNSCCSLKVFKWLVQLGETNLGFTPAFRQYERWIIWNAIGIKWVWILSGYTFREGAIIPIESDLH